MFNQFEEINIKNLIKTKNDTSGQNYVQMKYCLVRDIINGHNRSDEASVDLTD